MDGTVHIDPTVPFDEAARLIAQGLAIPFSQDIEGKYEEFPAWTGSGGGLRFVLLGVPLPEHDVRDERTNDYELQIHSEHEAYAKVSPGYAAHNIEVSAYFARLVHAKTGLTCKAIERPNAA